MAWNRYTCYVYGPEGLFSTYGASGRDMTKKQALKACRAAFAAEPVGRDVRPKKPKLVLRKE